MISLPFNGPILGIGIDIVDIDRIREIYDRQGERFLARVFTDVEQNYCLRMKFPHKHLAARFAAKEAVSKAFSTGIGDFLNWTSISVVSGSRGEPSIVLDDKGRSLLERVGGAAVAISLSHTDDTAIAFATIIGK
ncbi:MAG: holo-ACP synthase [Verrucomicrobiota bacterium]